MRVPRRPSSAIRLFTATAILGIASGQAFGQTVISAPTATDFIIDFRVADNTWEKALTAFPPPNDMQGPEFETFDIATRAVGWSNLDPIEGLEGLTAQFSGLSQQANGVLQGHDPAQQRDFVVETFFGATSINNFSRFNQTTDNPEGKAGTLQWAFDLTPLDDYLANNALALDALEVNLETDWQTGSGRAYDVLLSYDSVSEGLTLADISTDIDADFTGSSRNFHVLFRGSRDGAVGDLLGDDPRTAFSGLGDYNNDDAVDAADYTVWRDSLNDVVTPGEGADGDGSGVVDADDYLVWRDNYGTSSADEIIEPNTHKVLAINVGGELFDGSQQLTTIDLFPLYNEGVREFNLVAVTAGFGRNRAISIQGPDFNNPNDLSSLATFGSGVYISTSASAGAAVTAPEPSALALLSVALLAAAPRSKFA